MPKPLGIWTDGSQLLGQRADGSVDCVEWCCEGSLALSLCAAAHPLHTRFTDRTGASISEVAMRPNPRYCIMMENLVDAGYEVYAVDRCPTVRACPGRLSTLRVFPSRSIFVWRFCMGAQGA
jgi:hypothetical protein